MNTNGYELLDREFEQLRSLKQNARDYKIEIADLYKDETVIAVKIGGKDKAKLIYNIEQSKTAITLLVNGEIQTDKLIKAACLWFVTHENISSITDINSIQFLLAIESWRRQINELGLKPMLYHSHYIQQNTIKSG